MSFSNREGAVCCARKDEIEQTTKATAKRNFEGFMAMGLVII